MNNSTVKTRRALGSGLSALLGAPMTLGVSNVDALPVAAEPAQSTPAATAPADKNKYIHLPIESLHSGRAQPRKHFNEEGISELARSISAHGILSPILVSADGNGQYSIIAGERRWRAAKIAGLAHVPTIVTDITHQDELACAMIENVQRADLNPMEEAAGYRALMLECNYTQEEISAQIGKSRSHIANVLRLFNLPREAQDMISERKLSLGHAKVLAGISDFQDVIKFAAMTVENELSVRELEQALAQHRGALVAQSPSQLIAPKPTGKPVASTPTKAEHASKPAAEDVGDVAFLAETASEAIGTKVTIEGKRVIIEYGDMATLDRIIVKLTS